MGLSIQIVGGGGRRWDETFSKKKLFRSDGRKCTGQILARKNFLRSDGRNWDEF